MPARPPSHPRRVRLLVARTVHSGQQRVPDRKIDYLRDCRIDCLKDCRIDCLRDCRIDYLRDYLKEALKQA